MPDFKELRGKAAIVGIGETEHRRSWPGRTDYGLCSEAGALAIQDAGLEPGDIDCLVTLGANQQPPGQLGHYMGLNNIRWALGSTMMGSSAGAAFITAANLAIAGAVKYVLGVFGGARDVSVLGHRAPGARGGTVNRMAARTRSAVGADGAGFGAMPYGQTVAANNGYGHMHTRHMHEFGTTQEQLAKLAVDQRFNTLNNPRSHFARFGAITVEDVLQARYTNYPITLLQSVMPVAGAIAFVLTSAERATSHPHRPVYILGIGLKEHAGASNMWTRWTETGTKYSARIAFEMAGYGPDEMDFANVYD